MFNAAEEQAERPPRTLTPKTLRRVRTEDLFEGEKEIIVEHGDQDYRLRITAQGKLILTK